MGSDAAVPAVTYIDSCDKERNNKTLISDIPAMSIACDADNIYILARES